MLCVGFPGILERQNEEKDRRSLSSADWTLYFKQRRRESPPWGKVAVTLFRVGWWATVCSHRQLRVGVNLLFILQSLFPSVFPFRQDRLLWEIGYLCKYSFLRILLYRWNTLLPWVRNVIKWWTPNLLLCLELWDSFRIMYSSETDMGFYYNFSLNT